MMQITERDKKFLLMVNETGVCTTQVLFKFYPTRYAKDRIEKMGIEKIVNRKYGLIMIGLAGKYYLESIGVVPKMVEKLSTSTQKRLAQVSELIYLLPNMTIETSGTYKTEKKSNRGMQFVAVATTKDNISYLIYEVPNKISLDTKTKILKELKNKKDVNNNAIVFTRNNYFFRILSSNNIFISELLLMPPSVMCINLVNAMGEGNFDRRVIGAAFPELIDHKMFSQKQTEYIDGTNTYINLVLHNVSTTAMLSIYDKIAFTNNTSSNQIYNIVCLDIQLDFNTATIENLNLRKLNVVFKTIAPGQTSFY